jgi:hypothetical protein
MTIRQIFEKYSDFTSLSEGNYGYFLDENDFTNAAKELIEYHVKEALLKLSKDIPSKELSVDWNTFDHSGMLLLDDEGVTDFQDSILNSYPLNLIK